MLTEKTIERLKRISEAFGVKMTVGTDAHYLNKEDADAHDTLLCMNTNSEKDDPNRFHFESNEFYVKTCEELREAFKWMDGDTFDECIKNNLLILKDHKLIPTYDGMMLLDQVLVKLFY